MKKTIFFITVTALSCWAGWAEGKHHRKKLDALGQCMAEKTSIVAACSEAWLKCGDDKIAMLRP